MMQMELLPPLFSVAKYGTEPEQCSGRFLFYARTDREISIVAPETELPAGADAREDGWRAMRVKGTLDFSLIGILSRISAALAAAQVGIFVVSTFDTDYVLVKQAQLARALAALAADGIRCEDFAD